MTEVTGGCLCGAIRYVATMPVIEAGWCHCRMCQRSSGAPAQPFAIFAASGFRYVGEEPAVYRSSERGERRFCRHCGSSLEFRTRGDPIEVSVNTGTLDDPSIAPPQLHIWTGSRVSWFKCDEMLPQFSGEGDGG